MGEECPGAWSQGQEGPVTSVGGRVGLRKGSQGLAEEGEEGGCGWGEVGPPYSHQGCAGFRSCTPPCRR